MPITIETDASRLGLAAVMKQDNKVVRLLHRSLKPVEIAMPITLLELNAVIYAVEKWDPYLSGSKFTVVTDHKALTWLKSCKETYGKLAEWAYKLDSYDFEIVHRPGLELGLADTLSRMVATVVQAESLVPTLTELLRAQGFDVTCKEIKLAIEAKERKTLDNFVIAWSGVICKHDQRYGYPILKPVVPPLLHQRVLRACHEETAHMSPAETARRAVMTWHWRGITEDAMEFARRCWSCQERKGPSRNRILPVASLFSDKRNQLVSVDIMSGLPLSQGGAQYVLGACDNFTKLLRLGLLKSKTAAETASTFKTMWIDDLGKPEIIHSDQGTEFWGREFGDLCRNLNIKKSWTTDYHPAGDGQIERNFQTIAGMLASSLTGPRNGWPQALKKVEDAYNSAQHAYTGHSPNFLFFGEEKDLLSEAIVRQPIPSLKQLELRRKALVDATQSVRQKTKSKLQKIQTYNQNCVNIVKFCKGDLVWVKVQATMEAVHSKISRPYVLCRVLMKKDDGVNYVVRQLSGPLSRIVNVKNMKPYYGDTTLVRAPASIPLVGPQVSEVPQLLVGQPEEDDDDDYVPHKSKPVAVQPEGEQIVFDTGVHQPLALASPPQMPVVAQPMVIEQLASEDTVLEDENGPQLPVVSAPVEPLKNQVTVAVRTKQAVSGNSAAAKCTSPPTEVIRRSSTRVVKPPARYADEG